MTTIELRGVELRSLLVLLLLRGGGPQTVAGLERAVATAGFRAGSGRPSKEIADALRWEVRRGRVVRLGRGRYAPGEVAKVTRHRMRGRIEAARRRGHGAHQAAADAA
jgi:hypothetical protein